MSKALVIKGANFSINKVETITLSNPIPCEGISLSQNTMSATKLGAAGTLTATLTPADTTDSVIWISSDETVATVSNGVVTVVGIGSTTITAMCGSYSATCSISSAITLTTNDLDIELNKYIQTGASTTNWMRLDDLSSDARTYGVATSPDVTQSGYKSFTNSGASVGEYPIMIPKNTTQIIIGAPSGIFGITPYFTDSTKHPDNESNGVKLLYKPSSAWGTSGTFDIPQDIEDIDSFIINITFRDLIETVPSNISIVFS